MLYERNHKYVFAYYVKYLTCIVEGNLGIEILSELAKIEEMFEETKGESITQINILVWFKFERKKLTKSGNLFCLIDVTTQQLITS